MKKVVLLTIGLAFSAISMSAQSFPVKTSDLKAAASSDSQTEKIKEALMKDEDLQSKTIDYLKKDPETAKSVMDLASNSSSNSDLMKSILGDKSLTSHAIDYITKNPKLLKQALKVVGL
ncbi:hypothetical protein Q4566_09570 [Tamlana sp. 2_MG-2023]|uniref:hypothetical protein n=1 Tax=unclassified Tamlana TaxID=2614803 RepID=UPI0026E3BC03|nr:MULTISPECIES: hypothetical protein [unclassified Tamlana]MDO6760444.1 hypothetical protein [Tamlana sp. 2_MG-2023]MDO6789857.1 hypothetical protein [Tamlana sp. 1_MG-2023]